MRVLVACEFSGIVRDAFIAKGHEAMSCDLLPTERPGPHYQGDVFDIINDGWDMMIGHPPCTYLSIAGNRHFNIERYGEKAVERHRLREKALEFFRLLMESFIDRVCLENPVGYLSKNYRKPDQIIQPYYFGDPHIKPTCLWLKGLPLLKKTSDDGKPEPIKISYRLEDTKYHKKGDVKKHYFTTGKLRDPHLRSITFQGIADAMADQWG